MEGAKASWVGRLGVAYMEEQDTYVMLVQHECDDPDNSLDGDSDNWSKQVLVLTCDSPTGKFEWNQRINMTPYTGGTSNTGDQTLFTDEETGKDYLVYSYGSGRSRVFICEIEYQGDGLYGPTLDKNHMLYKGAGREGNCMFKYNGAYYLCASDLYGWNASHAYYMKLDSLEDDYLTNRTVTTSMTEMDGASDDYCHVTQTGFFYTVQGSEQETVIFCGDRWAEFAGNGLGFNQWCPLSFDASGTPYFNSLSSWHLNEEAGTWSVAEDNNYVKNGSFDADRISVTTLTGWTNSINEGSSPIKNSKNVTTGKYGLALTDTVDFDCSIYQTITSSPYVTLPDGVYELSAKVKSGGTFENLQLYAKSNGLKISTAIEASSEEWTTVTLSGVCVSGGWSEIGIAAAGEANAYCYIDDISFVKTADTSSETGTISGTIASNAPGKILTITAIPTEASENYTYEVTMTEGEQSFAMGPVKAGTYTLTAVSYGCAIESENTEVIVTANETSSGTIFQVTSNVGNVTGQVVDESNAPLSDVKVTLTQGETVKEVLTDSNGIYTFTDIASGECELTFEKAGYAAITSVKVTVVSGQAVTVDSQELVISTGTIHGTVYDSTGAATANATVLLRGCNSVDDTTRLTIQTDENGNYTFENVIAGTYAVSASIGSWNTTINALAQNVEVTRNTTTTVDLNIPEEIEIVNGGFEQGSTTGWTSTGSSGKASSDKKHNHVYSGSYGYTVWKSSAFTVKLEQTLTGLENGTYIVHMTVAGGTYGTSDEYYMYAKNANGDMISTETIPLTVNGSWELIGLTAEVTDRTLTFGVEGSLSGGAWSNMDDFRVGKAAASEEPTELAIIQQPADYIGSLVENAVFKVTAQGDGLTYQWQYSNKNSKNWYTSSMTGNTTDTLTVPVETFRDGQKYRCIISDQYGNSITSDIAVMTIGVTEEELVILTQPESYIGSVGDTAVFTVKVTGTNLTYQWQYSNANSSKWYNSSMAGNQTSSLEVPVANYRNGQKYRCIITSENGRQAVTEIATVSIAAE